MAITYLTGKPGTGKSYYAVYLLWLYFVFVEPPKTLFSKLFGNTKNFIKDKEYLNAYTNINEFDYKSSNNIKKLDFDELLENLTILYDLYALGKSDSELIVKAKELNLFNSLFVIDESHNYLRNKDSVLIWWFTYHRHLYHDILLITQDVSLVSKEYFETAEHFYKSVIAEKRLSNKSFRFIKNSTPKFYKQDIIEDFTVPRIEEVFNLYQSGANNDGKSIVNKYIFRVLILFALVIIFTYFFINSFTKEKNEDIPHTNNKTQTIPQNKNLKQDPGTQSFNFYCFGNLCTYKDITFPKKFLIETIKNLNENQFYLSNYGKSEIYFIYAPKETFEFLNIPKKEKPKNETNLNNLLPSSLPLF